MNAIQRLLASIMLIVLIIVTTAPTVQAIYEEVLQNDTKEETQYQAKIDNKEKSNISTNFEILLACLLKNSEGNNDNTIELSEIPSLLSKKPSQTGIYVEKNSRNYFLNLINKLTNKNYIINEEGYLNEDTENLKDEKKANENYIIYTNKIDELINSKKTIIISISDKYWELNKNSNEILPITLEDDEYSLLFKDNDNEENLNDIVILNNSKYNMENTDNSSTYLMNKFLEVYYNNDKEFNNSISNVEYNKDFDNNTTENTTKDNNLDKNTIDEDITKDNNLDKNTIDEDISKEDNSDENEKNFNITLSGIIYNKKEITDEEIGNLETIRPSEKGIWVQEDARKVFLQFLNSNSIYTYNINENGYLVCDYTMKNNPNLDFVDKTQIDIEIEKILQENITFYVSINSSFLVSSNNNIQNIKLLEDEYIKTFDNEDNTQRIILLNSLYFNSNTKYDIELVDKFVKKAFNFNQGISLFSDTSKTGNMVSAQTVYAGPSDSDYAKVGSVDPNEVVYILGQQSGWYHIQYHAGSVQKSGFVLKSTLYNINVSDSDINEEIMTGGQRYAQKNLSLQSCDNTSISTTLGTVYAGEGLTLLYDYGYTGDNGSYRIAYIEISTSTGTKRGYVYNDQLDNAGYNTSVARVTATNSAYSGPDNSYVKLGGAYYNEFVSILAKEGDKVFVEYNTTGGRKRGYMSYSNLYNYNHPGWYNDFATNQRFKTSISTTYCIWWPK